MTTLISEMRLALNLQHQRNSTAIQPFTAFRKPGCSEGPGLMCDRSAILFGF